MTQPDYVAHVQAGAHRRACGGFDCTFMLSDIHHARANRARQGRLVACPDCLRALGEPEFAEAEAAMIDPADVTPD